jgi:hypothetical protein
MWNLSRKFEAVSHKALILGLALFFMAYEVTRALNVAMTFDEAATYLNYISSDLLSLFNFNFATNHFVNTFLAKICYVLWGNHDFVLRIPNLLGYGLYLIFSFLLLNRFVGKTTAVFGFCLLNLNPYLLDFFSLCRGYGLALGFLMMSLFFFASFLSSFMEMSPGAGRLLTISLGAAGASVLCNFTLLNVYLSMIVLAGLFFILSNYRKKEFPLASTSHSSRFPRGKISLSLILLIAVFNIVVISQDTNLSPKLFERVSVRIPGIDGADMKDIDVEGLDPKKQERPFSYMNRVWSIDQPLFLTGLLFKVPAALFEKIVSFEVQIGRETLFLDGHKIRSEIKTGLHKIIIFESPTSLSLKRSAVPAFKPAINWKGDKNYLALLALRFLTFVLLFALIAAFVYGSGWFIAKRKILNREQFRRLVHPTLALAGFIVYPLFMLIRNHELYWGGLRGLISSTWASLVNSSFYGKLYSPRQNLLVGIFCLSILAIFTLMLYIDRRKKPIAKLMPGALFPAIIMLAAFSTVLQKIFFKDPYLMGRTALFFIPLFVLFLIFTLQYLGDVNRPARWISTLLLAIVTIISIYHFSQTANTALTVEWRAYADTKELLKDLERIKEKDYTHSPKITLGVDWIFLPALAYYTEQKNIDWLDVRWISSRHENDIYYVEEAFDPARMILIKAYPTSGNMLVKARQQ